MQNSKDKKEKPKKKLIERKKFLRQRNAPSWRRKRKCRLKEHGFLKSNCRKRKKRRLGELK